MKRCIQTDYLSLRSFVETLPETFEQEGTIIYKVRNEIKVFEVGNVRLNVKRYGIPPLFNRVAYTWFRKSKAQRAYENAVRIKALGFDTPDPVAYLECYRNGLLHHAYFVSLQCPYSHLLKEFADGSPVGNRQPVVEALGSYVARLHESGVYHKDLSIGNILFETDEKGIHFSLVDLNRMDFCAIDLKKGCENFSRLRGGDDFFKYIARSYSQSRGFDEEVCLGLIRKSQQKSVTYFKRKSAIKMFRRRMMSSLRKDA